MNVLIKGMEMPESCSKCRFFVGAWCFALDESDWREAYNKPPDFNHYEERLKGCPLAETAEPKTGKWIPVTRVYKPKADEFPNMYIEWEDATEPDEIDAVKCSECGEVFDFADARNWCTQCGARMRGEEE